MRYYGRKVIKTDVKDITADNVVDVLKKAISIHEANREDIQYLWDVYRSKMDIRLKEKKARPEINNKVVINRANECVSFWNGYLLGEPVQYVSRGKNGESTESINILNEYMFAEEKSSKDKELAEWFFISGTSYRMALPDEKDSLDESPFEIYSLDPRYTFVVYHNGLGEKPVLGVKYVTNESGRRIYSCYTRTEYFEIEETKLVQHESHLLGEIPIIEYSLNNARLGVYEPCLDLLNAINSVESNRIDSIEQFVQSLLLLHNVDLSEEQYDKLREKGAIKFVDVDPQMKGEIEYLCSTLNQTEIQTFVDSMYHTFLTICGMPSQSDGTTSDSSNNGAVILRNGWQSAEARAKDYELMFKKSERLFLRVILNICKNLRGLNLKVSDVEIRFTRRNYENILQKTQVLTMLLDNPKVADKLAFEHCGMFPDSDLAYTISREEYEKNKANNEVIENDNSGNSGDNRTNIEEGQQSRDTD